MPGNKTDTFRFLSLWNKGNTKGLESLIARHLPWINRHVRRRMGPLLRRKAETDDYVQDTIVEFLRYGPRIVINDDEHFQALMVRIGENSLREKHDWFTARRGSISKERPLPPDAVLDLNPNLQDEKTPSADAHLKEREAWIRLGMEFLEGKDQEILILQKWDGLSFVEIGRQLGISASAARKRHNRAVERLAEVVHRLRKGDMPTIPAEETIQEEAS